jgi:hypothetical protein
MNKVLGVWRKNHFFEEGALKLINEVRRVVQAASQSRHCSAESPVVCAACDFVHMVR